jgi:hypothetical protein|eukprot:1443371-Prymnesium_polylepis.1
MVGAVFSVLAKNFEQQRSSVVSVAKSWVGVSAGVGTAIYVGLFPSDGHASKRLYFLFFIAAVCGAVPILISGVLKHIPEAKRSRTPLAIPIAWRLPTCYAISILLIATTLFSTIESNVGFSVTLTVLLASPAVLLWPRMRRGQEEGPGQACLLTNADVEHVQPRSLGGEQRCGTSPWESGPSGMLKRPEFYLASSVKPWQCRIWPAAFGARAGRGSLLG